MQLKNNQALVLQPGQVCGSAEAEASTHWARWEGREGVAQLWVQSRRDLAPPPWGLRSGDVLTPWEAPWALMDGNVCS